MQTREDLEKQLERLRQDYRIRRSIPEMLEKSTVTAADLPEVGHVLQSYWWRGTFPARGC